MQIITDVLNINTLPMNLSKIITDKELFFDIETTGLSAANSNIYLIGCLYIDNDSAIIKQFFCNTKMDEVDILLAFKKLCDNFDKIISFNGETFDIPYLEQKFKKHGLLSPFERLESLDLYKLAKKYKHILNTPNLKQKTIEFAFGQERIDPYTGKDLINKYLLYEKTQEPNLFDELILHNYEDIYGMIYLLNLKVIDDLDADSCCFRGNSISLLNYDGQDVQQLILDDIRNLELTREISCRYGDYYLLLNNRGIHISVAMENNSVKVPYDDYKQYVYLISEDIAVPKTLATGISKDNIKKCDRTNCYGRFQITEQFFSNHTQLNNYAIRLLKYILSNK